MIIDAIKKTKLFQLIKALSKRERFVFIGALTVVIISGFTYASLLVQTRTYQVPAEGGEFTEGIAGQPVFINPIMPTTEADRDIARIIFSSVSEVSDSIKRSEDGKTWNVRIKENIFWQDGERLTADDIIFTLEVIQDPDSRSPLHASFRGVAAERISELEVRFVLQNTYAFFDSDHLTSLRIIPKHIFSEIPVQNIKLSSFGLNPIGSGPYQVDSFEKNSDGIVTSMRLKANKDYFDGRPNIKTFVFRFYRNAEEQIHAYNLGQVDGFGISSSEPLIESNVFIRNTAHYLDSPRYYAVFINQSLAPEALKDLAVRETLSATADRDRIISEVFMSHAVPMFGPTVISKKPMENFDTTLLQGLQINLTVPEEDFLVKTANILKENWESHGATVNVLIFSLKNIQENVLKNSDYELILFGNITKKNQDLFAFWHSSERFYPNQNLALYQSNTADELLEDYRKIFDNDERFEILTAISDTIASNVPAIFLYSPHYVYVTAPRLGGFDESIVINTSDDRFNDIHRWHVKTKRAFGSNPDAE